MSDEHFCQDDDIPEFPPMSTDMRQFLEQSQKKLRKSNKEMWEALDAFEKSLRTQDINNNMD